MTFLEAHNLMDLLLDKADQAYFTTAEKDKFLSMAIMEWFEGLTSDYLKNAGHESHEGGKYVQSEERTFKEDGVINLANNTKAITPHPLIWATGTVYPFYKLINLRVKAVDGSWEKVNPMNPGTLAVEGVKDPFNTPTVGNRVYNYHENKLKIFPNTDLVANDALVSFSISSGAVSSVSIIDGGAGYTSPPAVTSRDNSSTGATFTATINGSGTVTSVAITSAGANSDMSSGRLKIDESPTSAKFQMNYFTYPLLSNVAGGNSGGVSAETIATSNAQLGATTMAYAPYEWSDGGSSISNLGAAPREADNIVKIAVRMMTANIESPLYQTNSIEGKRSE
jgi:hypothetical protein